MVISGSHRLATNRINRSCSKKNVRYRNIFVLIICNTLSPAKSADFENSFGFSTNPIF